MNFFSNKKKVAFALENRINLELYY